MVFRRHGLGLIAIERPVQQPQATGCFGYEPTSVRGEQDIPYGISQSPDAEEFLLSLRIPKAESAVITD
jgi:hypothetical protein